MKRLTGLTLAALISALLWDLVVRGGAWIADALSRPGLRQ